METSKIKMHGLTPELTFNPEGPFHALVVGYLAQVHGCFDALYRGSSSSFVKDEPKRPNRWKNLSITRDMQGMSLFPDPPEKGCFGPGDVLYLLADIDAKYFPLKNA